MTLYIGYVSVQNVFPFRFFGVVNLACSIIVNVV